MIVIYTSTKYFTYATVYLIDKIHSKAYNVCVTYVTIAKKYVLNSPFLFCFLKVYRKSKLSLGTRKLHTNRWEGGPKPSQATSTTL